MKPDLSLTGLCMQRLAEARVPNAPQNLTGR